MCKKQKANKCNYMDIQRFHGLKPRFQPGRFRGFPRFRAGYGPVPHFSTRIRHVFSIGSCRFRTGPCLDGFGRLKTRFGACRFSRFGPFGHLYLHRRISGKDSWCIYIFIIVCVKFVREWIKF